ncbi:single-stranded DNA-binding replication protein A [Tothia fuscella]|uniref:Replication protein A subunit n=1 Tax=Tothia fuscella TaxID=1048955 RepID=A0A9P4P0Q9_9PEZI|nr:single-stranded DNA-binding replication protein A [Tothia fuscella]
MAGLAEHAINKGSLRAIFQQLEGLDAPNYVQEPVLQCVQIKPMANKAGGDSQDRYRIIFNDTENFIQSMLATQSNYLITDGLLKKGSIVKLKAYNPNVVKDKKILIVVQMEVLTEYGEHEKIGEPVSLDGPQKTEAQPQPAGVSASGFYGNKPPVKAEPVTQQRSLPSRTAESSSHGNLYPIEALSPYAHKWTIKARVTMRSEVKTWHNANGEGKLFSVNLLDESGEIRATCFGSTGDQFDQWYEMLTEGSVHYISSPCSVKLAKKQFSNLNNDYELTFERDTKVEKAEDQTDVPQVTYNFTSIGDLQNVEKDTTIDTIGILKDVAEVNEIVSKTTSKPFSKRELTLVDNTLHSIRLTIWGNTAINFDVPVASVIAFKGVKVSDFGGRSLSLLSSGTMTVDPDVDEAHNLKGWYDASGHSESFNTHAGLSTGGGMSTRKDDTKIIAQIKDENLGMTETPDFFTLKATIVYIKPENNYYPACQSEDCNKKVVEIDPGQWRCEKCDKTMDRPNYRYVMSVNVSDHTGQIWLSGFDDTGRLIMGKTADEVHEMKEAGENTAAAALFHDASCKTYIFRCKARMDTFRDEQRVRYQISSASPVNFKTETAKLTELIHQYTIQGGNDDSLFVSKDGY